MKYVDGQLMGRLYEKFILNYYKKEHPSINANDSQIKWQLDDLKNKIRDKKEILFVVNEKLSKKTDDTDNQICKYNIDALLKELENLRFGYYTARDLLGDLKIYSNKFSKTQLDRLCYISTNNPQVYNCFICEDNLFYILNNNKDIIDSHQISYVINSIKDKIRY